MNINQEIIVKYLQRKACKEEQLKFEQWLIEDSSHQAYFDQIEVLWRNADFGVLDSSFDTSKAWSRIISETSVVEPPKVVPFWSQTWVRLAASIVLAIGMVLVVYDYQSPTVRGIASVEYFAGDLKKTVDLPDGSIVTLRPYSQISYLENFIEKRELNLSGGAYFDVQHRNGEPFDLLTNNLQVSVLGTKFFVNESNERAEVFVEEGKVAVSPNVSVDRSILTANEGLYINSGSTKMISLAKGNNITSWKTGVLEFNNVQLTNVLEDIGKHYNVALRLKNSSIGRCHLTSTFDNKSIDEVLDVLRVVLNVEIVQRNPNEYLISGKGC